MEEDAYSHWLRCLNTSLSSETEIFIKEGRTFTLADLNQLNANTACIIPAWLVIRYLHLGEFIHASIVNRSGFYTTQASGSLNMTSMVLAELHSDEDGITFVAFCDERELNTADTSPVPVWCAKYEIAAFALVRRLLSGVGDKGFQHIMDLENKQTNMAPNIEYLRCCHSALESMDYGL